MQYTLEQAKFMVQIANIHIRKLILLFGP